MKRRLLIIGYVIILLVMASFKLLTMNKNIIFNKGIEELSKNKVLAYITDCSSEYESEYRKEEARLYGENTHKFIIQPADSETEIIVSEIERIDDEIHEVKEKIRTKDKLVLVMESAENAPYLQVKAQNGIQDSCWIPTFSEDYAELLVPEEFKVLKMNN